MSYTDASKKLQSANLKSTKTVVDGIEPLNQVKQIGGGNSSGQSVPVGSVIQLVVSNDALFTVPSITNVSLDSAAAQLKQAGWKGTKSTIAQTDQEVTDTALIDVITSQNPGQGAVANKSAAIAVQVGVPYMATVPDVRGQDVGAAESQMSGAQLVDVNFQQVGAAPSAALSGKVIDQSVSGGSVVDFRTGITVTYYGNYVPPPPPSTPKTTPKTTAPAPSTPPARTPGRWRTWSRRVLDASHPDIGDFTETCHRIPPARFKCCSADPHLRRAQ